MNERSGRGRGRLAWLPWAVAAVLLAVVSIPWFLWRDSTVVAGLPLWVWWHVGWLCIASLGFLAFTRYGWGVGVEAVEDGTEASEVTRDG